MDDGGQHSAETVTASGHENVTGRHGSTFEVTTDASLTPAGDCILGVGADRAPADFDLRFVAACRDETSTITATIEVADDSGPIATETVTGRGHPDLTFADERSLVVRTSEYVDDRTVVVSADAAAGDVDRGVVEALARGADLALTLRVEG